MLIRKDDDPQYGRVLRLVRSLELVDDLMEESTRDTLWYRLDLIERLWGARNTYRGCCAMGDMFLYLASIRASQNVSTIWFLESFVLLRLAIEKSVQTGSLGTKKLQEAGSASLRNASLSNNGSWRGYN